MTTTIKNTKLKLPISNSENYKTVVSDTKSLRLLLQNTQTRPEKNLTAENNLFIISAIDYTKGKVYDMYKYKREPLSNEETDRLIQSCKTPTEKLIVIVLLDTGMRVSELATLTQDNIFWQQKNIIVHGKGGDNGTMSKRRVIPMTERVYTTLSAWYSLKDDFGITIRTIQYHVSKLGNRANIKKSVSPHVLRHTFAVSCVEKGISTKSLQVLLGHENLTTTEQYLNVQPEYVLEEFRNKFQNA